MSRQSILVAGVFGILLSACATATTTSNGANSAAKGDHWVASWGTSQMVPDTQNELPAAQWRDASLRQVVRVALAGRQLRVKLSNVFGTAPLVIDASSVALALALAPGNPNVDPASVRPLRFNGSA